MTRSSAVSVESNFSKGLVTEATALNFPENACYEMDNCVINNDGSIQRRLGINLETSYALKTINRTDRAVSYYTWKNVNGDSTINIFVLQVGSILYFYNIVSSVLSSTPFSNTVSLTPVSGATVSDVIDTCAHYADGKGYLIVTHPFCDPIRVSFDGTSTFTSTSITLKIRDFEGDPADPYAIDERPVASRNTLNRAHYYNLYNQGWQEKILQSWDNNLGSMPSNSEIMWLFKTSTGSYDLSENANTTFTGNSPAPKGHFILELANQDRDTASGLTGVTATTTGIYRPSTCAFFAGRFFYAGIQKSGFNSKIYFTQIIERDEQFGLCYQVNDPASEHIYDLLPSDGGVIDIQDAGTIIKLTPIVGGLLVNAINGVWFITGSSALGFTANDYTVQKIASVPTLSADSFTDVRGFPCWWNTEGIWTVVSEGNLPKVVSLIEGKIDSFYEEIPQSSKLYARGKFNPIEGTLSWSYRSTAPSAIEERYEHNKVLVLNTKTGGFYPWTISNSSIKINGGIVVDTGSLFLDKYIVSYPVSGTYRFTFAEINSTTYLDWSYSSSVSSDFTSYFITGSKFRGQAMSKFQTAWTKMYSGTEVPVTYKVRSLWDGAETGSGTSKWSVGQIVEHTDTDFAIASRKLKLRGIGNSVQLKVESIEGEPFHILGWVCLNNSNQLP